jgi:hypothetical protein
MEDERFGGESGATVMCRTSDVLKRIVGISEYAPGAYPHAKVRKPTWHGTRGNGHTPGLQMSMHPVIERLSREHRLIRQMLADAARRCGRGQRE